MYKHAFKLVKYEIYIHIIYVVLYKNRTKITTRNANHSHNRTQLASEEFAVNFTRQKFPLTRKELSAVGDSKYVAKLNLQCRKVELASVFVILRGKQENSHIRCWSV